MVAHLSYWWALVRNTQESESRQEFILDDEPDNNWADDKQHELQGSNEPSMHIVPYSLLKSQDDDAT